MPRFYHFMRYWIALGTLLGLWGAFFLLPTAAYAAERVASSQMTVIMLAESERPAPGSRLRVAFRFLPEPGWHSYWRFPGDAGIATVAGWDLPRGVTASELLHPVPKRLMMDNLASFVHEGEHWLLTEIRVPKRLAVGSAFPIGVDLSWAVCSDAQCVPQRARFDLPLVIGDGQRDKSITEAFERAQKGIPKSEEERTAFAVGDVLRLPIGGISWGSGPLDIFVEDDALIAASSHGRVVKENGQSWLVIPARAARAAGTRLSAVVTNGREAREMTFVIADNAARQAASKAGNSKGGPGSPLGKDAPLSTHPAGRGTDLQIPAQAVNGKGAEDAASQAKPTVKRSIPVLTAVEVLWKPVLGFLGAVFGIVFLFGRRPR